MTKAIVIQKGDARRAVAQSAAISTREKSHASRATLTASLRAITITRRAMDGEEDSADIREKAAQLYYGFIRKSPGRAQQRYGKRASAWGAFPPHTTGGGAWPSRV